MHNNVLTIHFNRKNHDPVGIYISCIYFCNCHLKLQYNVSFQCVCLSFLLRVSGLESVNFLVNIACFIK